MIRSLAEGRPGDLPDAARGRLLNARMGRLTGRLTIDPYEERGWLLALYLMDDARFEAGGG